jgi:hypothetical protein
MGAYKLILSLAGLCVLAYVSYAWFQASNVPKTVDITTAGSYKSIPATICSLKNDNNTVSGTLYIFHDAARFDVTSIANGGVIGVHIIDSHEDNAYYWLDGQKTGVKSGYGNLYSSVGLSLITKVDCAPWWFPDGNLFVVPQDVTFQ